MKLRHKVLALAVLPLVLAIVAISTLVIYQSTNLAKTGIDAFEHNMLEAKQNELINLTNLALSAIKPIYAAAGPDDAAAKKKVKSILSTLDYGQDGYFLVYDYDGKNLVHPRQAFRVGKNWIDMEDPDGDRVIARLIDEARAGGGLHEYKWEKPSTGEVVEKMSFAVGLDKWGWMLGTGVYLDDVSAQTAAANADLKSSINRTFLLVVVITVPAVFAVFLTGMLINLHERRMADGKLNELTQRIINTQEEERSRIARELHDGISQTLIGVRYVLDLARRQVQKGGSDTLPAIERSAEGLNDAIKEVRRISQDLRPRLLDDLGLPTALEALLQNFADRTGIRVSTETVAFKNLMHPDARTAYYRVAQEALSNIERHARATKVSLTLTGARNALHLTIADNGCGFSQPSRRRAAATSGKARKPAGLGLRNMEERMAHFGGTLDVDSSRSGTVLRATLPSSVYITRADAKEAA